MKKLITTIAAAAFAASAFAQGYVNMGNGATTDFSTNGTVTYLGGAGNGTTTGLTTGSSGAPQGYYYALFAQSYSGSGPTAAVSITGLTAGGWQFTGALGTNSIGAGRETGGTGEATTQNAAIGADLQYIVLAWTGNESQGANVATILASLTSGSWLVSNGSGYVGVTAAGTVASLAGAPPSPSSALFGASPGITTPTVLDQIFVPTPEPATMALAAIGGASLLLFRRKK
jgi:hypothetical protein